MTKYFLHGFVLLTQTTLALGWFWGGYGMVATGLLLSLPVCLFLIHKNFRHTTGLIFGEAVILSGTGLWLRINPLLLQIAVIFALAAWDLYAFHQRLAFASAEDNLVALEYRHIQQVGFILLAGLLVNALTQSFQHKFGFEVILVLAIVAFLGIGILITRGSTPPPE